MSLTVLSISQFYCPWQFFCNLSSFILVSISSCGEFPSFGGKLPLLPACQQCIALTRLCSSRHCELPKQLKAFQAAKWNRSSLGLESSPLTKTPPVVTVASRPPSALTHALFVMLISFGPANHKALLFRLCRTRNRWTLPKVS